MLICGELWLVRLRDTFLDALLSRVEDPGIDFGNGTVQSSFPITGGRPVMEDTRHSIACRHHHVLASGSFLSSSSAGFSLRR